MHPTSQPKQVQTDTFAVFDDIAGQANLDLLGRVEVPRFSQPNGDGVRLSDEKRTSLAVARVLERDGTVVSDGRGGEVDHDRLEGGRFLVMTDMENDMEWVRYEDNPAFDGVWDPEEVEE